MLHCSSTGFKLQHADEMPFPPKDPNCDPIIPDGDRLQREASIQDASLSSLQRIHLIAIHLVLIWFAGWIISQEPHMWLIGSYMTVSSLLWFPQVLTRRLRTVLGTLSADFQQYQNVLELVVTQTVEVQLRVAVLRAHGRKGLDDEWKSVCESTNPQVWPDR